MEDGGRRVRAVVVEPVLLHDEEQETPCHPSSGAQCYITFMSVNRHFQEFSAR